MIVVTGAAGFIGSNIVKALNDRGRSDVLVVDDLSDGKKMFNLADCEIMDYLDKDRFIEAITDGGFDGKIEVIFHEGACSSTTEWDGRCMMENNYEYSKQLLHYCLQNKTQYIYASSASVYGGSSEFVEKRKHTRTKIPMILKLKEKDVNAWDLGAVMNWTDIHLLVLHELGDVGLLQ